MALRTIVLAFLSISISACVTAVSTSVENYSALPNNYRGTTVSIVAFPPKVNESLAWKRQKKIFESELSRKGFRVVSHDYSNYVAIISYGIDGGTTTTETVSTPIYGQTGGGYTTHSGTVRSNYGGYGSYYGSSYTMPTYGIVGTNVNSYNVTVFQRSLSVNIEQRDNRKRVFEGNVTSEGTCGKISTILPYLAKAMFEKFPNGSGEVEVPFRKDAQC
jgi:hypothetical protein